MRVITKILLSALTFTLAGAAHATTVDLPNSCGKDQVEFKVQTEKNHTLPAPQAGKALVVFVETVGADAPVPTARYGIDGAWVGATHGRTSYFAVSVEPGAHHLCAVRQSGARADKMDPGTASVSLEAGKVYFYEFSINHQVIGFLGKADGGGAGMGGLTGNTPDMTAKEGASVDATSFAQLTESAGEERVKKASMSVPTVK